MVRGLVSVFLCLGRLFPPVLVNVSCVLVGNCVGKEKLPCVLEKNTVELLLLTFSSLWLYSAIIITVKKL